jgi:hypothetical protein
MSVRRGLLASCGWLLAGCVDVPVAQFASEPSSTPAGGAQTEPALFELPRLESGSIRTADVLGRMTLVVFAATYDTPSQAAVPIASALVRRHLPRMNGLLVVLEPESNRPLAQAFVAALDVPFPVAMADAETLEGRGAFAGIRHVPSFVLLDREGREVWRRYGLATTEVLDEAVRVHEAR